MALFKIHKGNSANLANQSKVEGYCWFTTDDGKFYIDTSSSTRVPLNAAKADSAATWTTARNFTIGATARSVKGDAAVSWTVPEIGAISHWNLSKGYRFQWTSGTNDTNWKTIAIYQDTDTDLTVAKWNGATIKGIIHRIFSNMNDGLVTDIPFTATFTSYAGNGTTAKPISPKNIARLYIPASCTSDMIRIVRVGVNHFELQLRIPVTYQHASVQFACSGQMELLTIPASIATTANPDAEVVADYANNYIRPSDKKYVYYDGTDATGTWDISITGTAANATQLATERSLKISGTAGTTGTNFDGSADATLKIPATVKGFSELETNKISSAASTALYIAPSSTLYLRSAASASMIFQPQGVEKARFNATGEFLIKTAMYPGTTNTYNLGTSNYKWKNVYATTLHGDGVNITNLDASNISSGTLAADRLATSGVEPGTYGPETAATPAHGDKIVVPKIVVDNKGRITSAATQEITLPADTNTDTKNTAGSTNTSNKIFLIGATSQAANPQTYSHDTVYVDADGNLNTAKLIVNTTDTPGIIMNRGSYNYIQGGDNAPICLIANNTMGLANASLVAAKTAVHPGKNNTFDLGSSTYKWKNVYATTYHGGTATTSAEGLMSAADKAKVDAALVLQSTRITDSISLDDTTLAAGIYVVDGFTLDDVKYYGTFVQYGGSYHTQVLHVSPSGAQGKMVIYTRRYVSGSSSWSPWIKIDSVIKEASLKWGGQALTGEVSPVDAAMSSIHGANRFAFADPSGITVEYSNDAGATWNSYTTTDAQKVRLVSGIGSSYQIGGPDKAIGTHTVDDQLRISLVARSMGVYTSLQKILLNVNPYLSTGCKVKVEHSTYGAQTTFVTDDIYDIGGISAWNWNSIPFGGVKFGSTSSSNWYMIRLTFSVTAVSSSTTSSSALTVSDVVGHGPTYWTTPSSMAKTGHLYTYDENQAAIFSGSVTVKNTSMYINGETAESVVNTGFQLQHNGNSIGKLFCSKAGTTSQGGTCQLVLGNTKSSTSNYNARGSIMIYSEAATGVTLLAHTIGTNYSYYFRNHDATIYSVGTSTRAAVGDESTPVYVNSNGFLTPCTSLSSGTDNEGNTISETYLKLTGGTVSGEVNSSANVATSSAAFRNIKVIAPGTEVVAGTTAIPTGEIWVRYEE